VVNDTRHRLRSRGGSSKTTSEFSTPNVDERHFSTLNAEQQATSLLEWQIDKKQQNNER
jgi:hypothetical protein